MGTLYNKIGMILVSKYQQLVEMDFVETTENYNDSGDSEAASFFNLYDSR